MGVLTFFIFNPVGRVVSICMIAVGVILGVWTHGDLHGRKAMKLKIEQEKQEAILKGNKGAADALKKLESNTIPDYWFRD
jgi:hypothetical protein